MLIQELGKEMNLNLGQSMKAQYEEVVLSLLLMLSEQEKLLHISKETITEKFSEYRLDELFMLLLYQVLSIIH